MDTDYYDKSLGNQDRRQYSQQSEYINTFQRSCSNHTYQVLSLSPLCLLSEFFYNHNRPYLNMVSTMLWMAQHYASMGCNSAVEDRAAQRSLVIISHDMIFKKWESTGLLIQYLYQSALFLNTQRHAITPEHRLQEVSICVWLKQHYCDLAA